MHKDNSKVGYSKAFEDGWNKIEKEPRIPCKDCKTLISKFYAKNHNGLCIQCSSKRKR